VLLKAKLFLADNTRLLEILSPFCLLFDPFPLVLSQQLRRRLHQAIALCCNQHKAFRTLSSVLSPCLMDVVMGILFEKYWLWNKIKYLPLKYRHFIDNVERTKSQWWRLVVQDVLLWPSWRANSLSCRNQLHKNQHFAIYNNDKHEHH